MASKLEQLRQKLLDKETKTQSFASDNAIYPFWNIPFSAGMDQKPAVIRFLPDGNENNDFFWVEMQKIRLKFPGIKGQRTDKEVEIQVPCMEMYDGENSGTCPIMNEIRPWFKDTSKEEIARSYWKKRSYIFQGFVRDNPLTENDAPENPIRRLIVNPSLFKIIKAGIFDPDMDEMPTDAVAGTDFRIIKTKNGQYANYDTSSYARRSSSLTDSEKAIIENYGLKNLNDFLPKKPGDAELQAIFEMFEASLDGDDYDPSRWARFYKPYGLKLEENGDSSTTDRAERTEKKEVSSKKLELMNKLSRDDDEDYTPPARQASVNEDDDADDEVEEKSVSSAKKAPRDILAELKARTGK